jgi:hypothetical protein
MSKWRQGEQPLMIRVILFFAFLAHLAVPSQVLAVADEQISDDGRQVALTLSNDLIQGIATADCDCDARVFTILMDLQPGEFSVTDNANTSTQRWRIPDGTKLTINFHISDSKVVDPVVAFTSSAQDPEQPSQFQRVEVTPAGSTKVILPSSIQYGALGANKMFKPQNLPIMTDHLSISSDPLFLFTGNPFRIKAAYIPVGSNDPLIGRPLIREVVYPAGPEGSEVNVPPILMTFKKDTLLRLSRPDPQNSLSNTLKLTGESTAKLNVYHYWTETKQVFLSLSQLDLHLSNSSLNASGFSLPMQNGSLMLDKLQILSSSTVPNAPSDTRASIVAEKVDSDTNDNPALDSNLAPGASIAFGDSVGLLSSSESSLTFKSLHFSFSSGSLLSIAASGISSMKMKLLEARLGFGERGNLKLGPVPGSATDPGPRLVELKLQNGTGTWMDSAVDTPADAFQLRLTDLLAAPVLSGRLAFFPDSSAIEIDRGSFVNAPELTLASGNQSRGLTGSLSGTTLKLKTAAASPTITVNNLVRLKPGSDVTITSDATDPVTFKTENKAVSGRFNIQGNFSEAQITTDAPLALNSLNASIDASSDGTQIRALSIDISSAAISSTTLSVLPVGAFELNRGDAAGQLVFEPPNNRFVGSLRLTNFGVNAGTLRLNSGTTLNVTSVGMVPAGNLRVGDGPPGKVKLEASGLHLAARAPAKLLIGTLLVLESSPDMLIRSDGLMTFNPSAQFPEGSYSIDGSGVLKLAQSARIPLILDPGKVQMAIVSSGQTGSAVASFTAEGNGSLVSGTTQVPLRLTLTDGKYLTTPSEAIRGTLGMKFRSNAAGETNPTPRFSVTSFAPERTQKKQPKLFPVNTNFSFVVDSGFSAVQVIIDSNGLSSPAVSSGNLMLATQVLSGTGIYKYDDDKLGVKDKPTGHDKQYDDEDSYKPFRDYQELLRVRVNTHCKASLMVGARAVFQVPVAMRFSISGGLLKLDFSNQLIGPVPTSPDGTTLLLSGCSHDSDVAPATSIVASALDAYVTQHPLLRPPVQVTVQGDGGLSARQHISRLVALSIVNELSGSTPKLQFSVGTPRF